MTYLVAEFGRRNQARVAQLLALPSFWELASLQRACVFRCLLLAKNPPTQALPLLTGAAVGETLLSLVQAWWGGKKVSSLWDSMLYLQVNLHYQIPVYQGAILVPICPHFFVLCLYLFRALTGQRGAIDWAPQDHCIITYIVPDKTTVCPPPSPSVFLCPMENLWVVLLNMYKLCIPLEVDENVHFDSEGLE